MKHPSPFFTRFAKGTARASGRPATFALAVLVLVVWAVSGPCFHFSDTWQLVINTGTTIVTFLMVFLIQSTQNRESAALNLKVDEILRSTKGAKNVLCNLDKVNINGFQLIRTIEHHCMIEQLTGRSAAFLDRTDDGAQTGAGTFIL